MSVGSAEVRSASAKTTNTSDATTEVSTPRFEAKLTPLSGFAAARHKIQATERLRCRRAYRRAAPSRQLGPARVGAIRTFVMRLGRVGLMRRRTECGSGSV